MLTSLLHAVASLALAADPTSNIPDAAMLRYPDIGKDEIVFVFAGNLWLVPKDGGVARPLTTSTGSKSSPKFSPDGKRIAFGAGYDGGRDIYVMPVAGGTPERVTHHPAGEQISAWTQDGEIVFTASGMEGIARAGRIYHVKSTGGLPQAYPVPYGANGTVSPDGKWLAYTPHSIDGRTWKRYRGGMQTDIWLFNLETGEAKRITDWEGIDTLPMWNGSTLYYLTDETESKDAVHKLNIWSYDPASGDRKQVTRFEDEDIKWPSVGNGEIVFQKGTKLMVLDLASGKSRDVEVQIPGDRPTVRPRTEDVSDMVQGASISPSGKRVAVAARGDIWSAPAENGVPRNLTRTNGVAERSPAWSPDGKWIAYFDDSTGEYELWAMPADGKGQPKQLTKDGGPFKTGIEWAPDSKKLLYNDKTGTMYLVDFETAERKLVDKEPWDGGISPSWSHDSAYVAYGRSKPERRSSSIWIYDVAKGESKEVTSGMFNDGDPVFDRAGDWLYYTGQHSFDKADYSDLDTTWIYTDTQRLMAVPLRKDVKNAWLVEIDEEKGKDGKKDEKKDEQPAGGDGGNAGGAPAGGGAGGAPSGDRPMRRRRPTGDMDLSVDVQEEPKKDEPKKDEPKKDDEKPADGEKKDGAKPDDAAKPADGAKKDEAKKDDKKPEEKKPEEKKPIVIEYEGFESRAIELPVGGGRFGSMAVNDRNQLVFAQSGQIKSFDMKNKKREAQVIGQGGGFQMSADGRKLLMGTSIMDANPGAQAKPIVTQPMLVEIAPKTEWKQVVRDAWRIFRDWFYDPTMHGVDWDAVGKRYLAMVDDANSREDVSYIISEMISELNVGHAYYTPGREGMGGGGGPGVGMLGVDWELVTGENGKSAYRIKHIVEGAAWDVDARNPLKELGQNVKEGDFVLAVNGMPIDTSEDPWAAFAGLIGKTVNITVGPNPVIDDKVREIVVKPMGGEDGLRFRDWIESNRRYVEEKSDGKVGYIYVPSTAIDGQNELVRQFQGARSKDAIIVDDRWNSGGQIPTRFIELLNRPPTTYWGRRDQHDWTWPPDGADVPKAMLINGLAGSGGDMFPWLFRHNKLGPLVGTRTWGGLVGISGNPGMIDGSGVRVPVFAFYETDGTWGIEGHGVDPDFEVLDDPGIMKGGPHFGGADPQMDKAVELMLAAIKEHPRKDPPRPAYPNRRGMGIAPADK